MVQLAENGNSRAKVVLDLLKNPEGFLSAVQIGITLIGIVSGVYGGATLTDNFRPFVEQFETLRPYAGTIAYVLVVGLITYLSIVIGELIPKTLAMKFAEPVALSMAGFVQMFTRFAHPFVWLLTFSTNIVFKLFNIKPTEDEKLTEDELRHVIKTAGAQGLLDKDESEIHHNLLSFTELRAKSLMTHRLEVEWVDTTEPLEKTTQMLRESHRSHFPVCDGTYDNVLGYLHAKDFFARIGEPGFHLRSILREPIFVPETQYAIDILQAFRKSRCYFGIVTDEYGAFEGIVTLHDISEALVGDLPDLDDEKLGITRRDDGSLLISGNVLGSELNLYLQDDYLPENSPYFNSVAGFIAHKMEGLPDVGERFEYEGRTFEVVDKDGARIDKVILVTNAPED